MIWIIFTLLLNTIFMAMTAALFLRIRYDVDFLGQKKKEQIDLIQKFMETAVTHENMQKYVEKIQDEFKLVGRLRDKCSKEKWNSLRKAFGGKEGDNE